MTRLLKAVLALTIIGVVVPMLAFSQSTATGRSRGGPANHTLTVNSNVASAAVFVNGAEQKGSFPMALTLAAGTYNIEVRANGYHPFSQSVNLTANQTVTANLQQITHTLTVNSNVSGARVLINNQDRGATNFNTTLTPGTYNVVVRAPGYIDFTQSVNLTANLTVTANLQPATARVTLSLPANILDRTVNNAAGQVQVFVDNARVSGTTFEVPGGRRTIRVASGGVSAEVTMDFVAGRQYTVTPNFGFNVQQGAAAAAPAPAQTVTPAPAPTTPAPAPATDTNFPTQLAGNLANIWDPLGNNPSTSLTIEPNGTIRVHSSDEPSPALARARMNGNRLEILDTAGTVRYRMFLIPGTSGWNQRWQQEPVPGAPPGWRPSFLTIVQ